MSRALQLLRELEAALGVQAEEDEGAAMRAMSDEELEALEAWYEAGEPGGPEKCWTWVQAWIESRPPPQVVPDEPLEPEEPEVEEEPPLTEEIKEAPEPVPMPPRLGEGEEKPPATAPSVLRSCDYVPRSPWAGPPVERDESEEITFREEPLERVYSVCPPRRRRRSSGRLGRGLP